MDDDDFTTGLTPAATERLALLIEECGEVIQAATKVLRHGWDSHNPLKRDGTTNAEMLAKEIGQMTLAVNLLEENYDVRAIDVAEAYSDKKRTINRWLHFNKVSP